jgi:hypothetical protein
LKKNTETEPKPGQTDRFRFGSVWFFRAKTGSNRFDSVFPVLARFFPVLARFFSVWLGFSGLARFFPVFFGFLFIKPKPNRTGLFFQKFNRFNRLFFSVWFFRLFFSGFLGLIGFPVFLLTPTVNKCDDH